METIGFFRKYFPLLTGNDPFLWQENLFQRFLRGDIPRQIDLPTGAGKTSILYVWVLAIGYQAMHNLPITIARRLVYVVNRRVVVDQSTDEALRIRTTLIGALHSGSASDLYPLAAAIARISVIGALPDESPVAVSALRGELADNGQWRLDPSRPAIVIGTVDMIGSRLLFSGYGDGRSRRPLHAGLLGCDSLLVHDEAQLTPAFGDLIREIEAMQLPPSQPSWIPRFRALDLTATHRRRDEDRFPASLDEDAAANEEFAKRYRAKKTLRLHENISDPLKTIVEIALAHKNAAARVVVYVQKPETANAIAQKIRTAVGQEYVELLTGRMRGFERDALADRPVFKAFLAAPDRTPPSQSIYLICTSAGEVGVNLDADHLVCDLVEADSLIQRFGRVNRLGERESLLDLTVAARHDVSPNVLQWLKSLPQVEGGLDASPASLVANAPPENAMRKRAATPPLDRATIDAWSCTSIDRRKWKRSDVEVWLHGAESDLPTTDIVWRNDVEVLTRASEEDRNAALDAYPVKPWERLQEPFFEASKKLEVLAELHPGGTVLLIDADGNVSPTPIDKPANLQYATVILPASWGGLTADGVFDPAVQTSARDVSNGPADGKVLRDAVVLARGEDRLWSSTWADWDDAVIAIKAGHPRFKVVCECVVEADDCDEPNRGVVYLEAPKDAIADTDAVSYLAVDKKGPVFLERHNDDVALMARRIALLLGAPADLQQSVYAAGKRHDLGKNRPWWQKAIGNMDRDRPLAKSGKSRFNAKVNANYRHEFGSLVELSNEALDDLVLHLIACHHGHARPQFTEKAYSAFAPERGADRAAECLNRFVGLQRAYGSWGLAWVESIFKAADALVSAGMEGSDERAAAQA